MQRAAAVRYCVRPRRSWRLRGPLQLPGLHSLISSAWQGNKTVVASVCHGPAALLGALNTATGRSIVAGKQLCGFTNSKEEASQYTQVVPWLLEEKAKVAGALFSRGPDWQCHAVADGRLVTGHQNPASSCRVAELAVEAAGMLQK